MKTIKQTSLVHSPLRRYLLLFAAFLGLMAQGVAQSQQSETPDMKLRAGGAYFGENMVRPGIVLEFEYEKVYTPVFSLPLRANLGFQFNEDYQGFFLDLHKGFRKYFRKGLFLEQSLGVGIIFKSYGSDLLYYDQYYNPVFHGGKPVPGLMPSLTVGAGYDLSREKDAKRSIWIRPKVYWDMGFRKLHQPYFALQLGYSHTFKTR